MALHSKPKGIKKWLALKALKTYESKRGTLSPAEAQTVKNIRKYLETGHGNY